MTNPDMSTSIILDRQERAARAYPSVQFSPAGNILYYKSPHLPILKETPYVQVMISSIQVDDLIGPEKAPIYRNDSGYGLRNPIGEIGDDKPLPGFPGLFIRDGRIQGDPDRIVIALIDQLVDPILINYDLREIRAFLIEVNQT